MPDLTTLVVRIIGDVTNYQKSLKDAETDSVNFAQRATSGLASVGGTIVTGAAWAAGAAFTGLGFLINGAAREAMSAEEISAQLNATLANTGSVTGVTAGMVSQLAEKYQGLTRYEDDVITSGGEVLGRFKEINSTVFPDALRLSLDLATKWGTSVPDAAGILGKALADPGAGLMKLKLAGVVFNQEQEEMIKKMTEAGDVAGAQAVIMDVVNKAVGGAAEAAGKTAAGTWERLGNIWGNTLETIGTGLIPAVTTLGDTLSVYLNKPEVTAFIERMATGIADFAISVVTNLPTAIQWIQNAFGWLEQNQGVIVAVLAVIGVAIGAWVYTVVIPAAVAAMAAMWPVLLVMALVAAAAYLIYTAWTENWGGIQEKTAAVIAFVQELIAAGMQFISDLTSGKLGWMSEVWNNTWTAIMTVVDTIVSNVKLLIAAFQAAMSGDWHRFGELLREVWDNTWTMIGTILSTAWENFKVIFSTAVTNVITFFRETDWGEVGKNIVEGIANGITSSLDWIMDAAIQAAEAALEAAKGFLGINSPSRRAELEIGLPIGEGQGKGWIGGLTSMIPQILQAVDGAMVGIAPDVNVSQRLSLAGASVGVSGRSSGGSIQIVVENKPIISLSDRNEIEQVLKPILQTLLRDLGVEVD